MTVWFVLGLSGMRRARFVGCASNMSSIGLAGRMWANDHNGHMPTNFICMKDELVTPKVLYCPSDRAHERIGNWENFSETKSSYVMVTPGAFEGLSNVVFIRCSVHGHVGYTDGSVFHGTQWLPKGGIP
jgi:hypothetical protein